MTVAGANFYRLQTDAEWLKGLDEKTDITVEVMVQNRLNYVKYEESDNS